MSEVYLATKIGWNGRDLYNLTNLQTHRIHGTGTVYLPIHLP